MTDGTLIFGNNEREMHHLGSSAYSTLDKPANELIHGGGLTPFQKPFLRLQSGYSSPPTTIPPLYRSPYLQEYMLERNAVDSSFVPISGHQVPQAQYTPEFQNPYSNIQQQQTQYMMPYEASQQQKQHQQQYSQLFQQPTYGGRQQQPAYSSTKKRKEYGNLEEEQIVPNQASPSRDKSLQPPADFSGPDITHVHFNQASLSGEDAEHVVKAIHEANNQGPVISSIIETYLQRQRSEECHKLDTARVHHTSQRSTRDVMIYNHLMDRLESLSGAVSTKHQLRRDINPQTWQQAMNPHRRAIFAELYNSNPIVRGFCSDFIGGLAAFPLLDEYALGTNHHNLNLQRANQQAPNWNVARELLSQVRTVVLLDDSSSMASPTTHGPTSTRWDQSRDLLASIASLVSAHNAHGIDIHFLNNQRPFLGLWSKKDVLQVFQSLHPGGGTPTGRRVNDILDAYACTLRYNRSLLPLNFIIITSSPVQDQSTLSYAVSEHVSKIVQRGFQAHQLGIEILQVDDDEVARACLQRLEGEISRQRNIFQRDVVGVTMVESESDVTADKVLGIVLSGIDARMNGYIRLSGANV